MSQYGQGPAPPGPAVVPCEWADGKLLIRRRLMSETEKLDSFPF